MEEIFFFVPGIPAPGGSKRGIFNSKINRTLIFENNPEKNRNWRAAVALAASEAMNGKELLSGPLFVKIEFEMPRPKSHFSSKGPLKKTAPDWNTKKPDVCKLTRSTEDAMTGVVWNDDAQIVHSVTLKRYANDQCGARIRITQTNND